MAGIGISYSPFSGMEIRGYPLRTGRESQEVGFSFRKKFNAGSWNPYISSFGDVRLSGRDVSAKGEVQAGVKIRDGWRVFLEIRHSGPDGMELVESIGGGLEF